MVGSCMFKEIDLNDLKEQLQDEFDISVTVIEDKLYCTDYKNIFFYLEDLCKNLCYYIEGKYDCFADYCIDSCNSFTVEIF